MSLPPNGLLDAVPPRVLNRARWWEHHLLDVMGHPAGDGPVPVAFDPASTTLTQREEAKAAELTAAGSPVTARTIRARRQRYAACGLPGLIDPRHVRAASGAGRTDERVVDAMRQALDQAREGSTRTASCVLVRTGQILAAREDHDQVPVPSKSTLYRLYDRLTAGTYAKGTARARRSAASRPEGAFGEIAAAAPGELVQIDSTPFDVLVLLDAGVVGRVELTALVDVATRSIPAAVLVPSTKAVDAAALVARALVPEPMRPGWPEALRMSASWVLPHRRLADIDPRLEAAAGRPVIVPDTIVCDHGKVFISHAFKASCRFLGISLQPARKGTPTDKPHVERTLGSVSTLFAQYLTGYVGSGVEHRGTHVHRERLWTLAQAQDLLDEWIVACWQNRPHEGLRDPLAPGRAFTPNEKYAALLESCGYTPVALAGHDYIELLPVKWQRIGPAGVRLGRRSYDSPELDPLRCQPSGVTKKKDKWEVHYDPYDITRVWVRNHHAGGWITLFWKHLHRAPTPFGELAWNHVRSEHPGAAEDDLADAAADLLARAGSGPQPGAGRQKKARRVAAKSRAGSGARRPRITEPDPQDADAEPSPDPPPGQDDAPVAEVIPLGVFDPFTEARKTW